MVVAVGMTVEGVTVEDVAVEGVAVGMTVEGVAVQGRCLGEGRGVKARLEAGALGFVGEEGELFGAWGVVLGFLAAHEGVGPFHEAGHLDIDPVAAPIEVVEVVAEALFFVGGEAVGEGDDVGAEEEVVVVEGEGAEQLVEALDAAQGAVSGGELDVGLHKEVADFFARAFAEGFREVFIDVELADDIAQGVGQIGDGGEGFELAGVGVGGDDVEVAEEGALDGGGVPAAVVFAVGQPGEFDDAVHGGGVNVTGGELVHLFGFVAQGGGGGDNETARDAVHGDDVKDVVASDGELAGESAGEPSEGAGGVDAFVPAFKGEITGALDDGGAHGGDVDVGALG